jgi:hypothetical protein
MKGVGQRMALPLCLALALAVGGCVQTTTENFAKPAGPAAGNPFVLSSAGGGTAALAATPGEPAPAADAAAPPAATASEPPPPAAAAAVIKEPAPTKVLEPLPVSAPAAGPADSVPAVSQAANSFPNINAAPQQPKGSLLPPGERQRIITELEALRDGQSKPAPNADEPPATLSKEAETHGEEALKKIKKCSQEGAADKYPECAPAKTADQTPAAKAPAN